MSELAKIAKRNVIAPGQATMIQYQDEGGDIISISSDDVRARICPNANENEIAFFMETCRTQRLNPFTKDAYLVKYRDQPAQVIVAHKVLMSRTERNPNFDGMESGVTVLDRDGNIRQEQRGAFYKAAGEQLLGGWCRIYRKDRRIPFYAERSLDEMSKGQASWKSMPAIMITKCAQAACIREAFPDEFGGLYVAEERGQEVESKVEEATPVESKSAVEARQQPRNPDFEELASLSAECVAAGYDERATKSELWRVYRDGGIETVRTVVAGWVAERQSQAVADVDPETGEVVEMAEEDIDF